MRRLRRDKRAHLGHDGNKRHLPDIGGFPRHVGTGDDEQLVFGLVERGVVGNELPLLEHPFHNRVPAARNGNGGSLIDPGLHVVVAQGNPGQAEEHVHQGEGFRDALDVRNVVQHRLPHLFEQRILQRVCLLLRAQDAVLPFLQLGGDEPLRVDQRLLADVIGRREGRLGLVISM